MARQGIFGRPEVLAAIIGLLAGAISGVVSGIYLRQSDAEKLRLSLILNITSRPPEQQAEIARRFIQSGLLRDPDGALCMAFIGKDCPLKILKASN